MNNVLSYVLAFVVQIIIQLLLNTIIVIYLNMTVVLNVNWQCCAANLDVLYVQHLWIYFWCFCHVFGSIICYALSFVIQISVKWPFPTIIILNIVGTNLVKNILTSRIACKLRICVAVFLFSCVVCLWWKCFIDIS